MNIDSMADDIADFLGVDAEKVQVTRKPERICLTLEDAQSLLRAAQTGRASQDYGPKGKAGDSHMLPDGTVTDT